MIAIYLGFYNYNSDFWESNSEPVIQKLGINLGASIPYVMWVAGSCGLLLAFVSSVFLKDTTRTLYKNIGSFVSMFWTFIMLYLGSMAFNTSSTIDTNIDIMCNGGFPKFSVFSQELASSLLEA